MLLEEPPPTQADLHFRLFGFPVRVHPLFWIVTLLLGMGGGEAAEPVVVLIWTVVVFVSVLVHELGHAFVQRYFGGHPWITLYSFGGLASCGDCDRRPRSQILISLAGPVAGFLLAGLVILVLFVSGRFQEFKLDWVPVHWELFDPRYALEHGKFGPMDWVIASLLFVNIAWGVMNLLPIYPLDGGRIARELFALGNPQTGIVQSLQLSAGAAVLVAVYALTQKDFFLCIMFGFLAYGSFQTLQQYRNTWR
jgi:Zn-dependent protease